MIACVFSGQGSHYENMGKSLIAALPVAKQIYEQCSESIGFDLSNLTADQLQQTRYAQPATVALSLAAFTALKSNAKDRLNNCSFAGFSLGEYSLLGASGALNIDALMQLLNRRSEAMQADCARSPGGMAAILGLSDDLIETCCAASASAEEPVTAVNFNCPGQVVISGALPALERAQALCLEKGAKRAVKLPVSGAFHTLAMQNAAKAIEAHAQQLTFKTPSGTCYSNVSGKALSTSVNWPNYLALHMVSPVLWTQEVRQMIQDGVTHFIECGPGKTLSGLIRKIDRQVTVYHVEDEKSLVDTLNQLETLG